jgi:hypothetical protein
MSRGDRIRRYLHLSKVLAGQTERQLAAVLARARPLGTGIGGSTLLCQVAGLPVFAKRVPLTDVEQRSVNVGSTANMFGLPPYCQYGVGSPGFGAWRELAAHRIATGSVLTGVSGAFPLLYHWRVVSGQVPPAERLDIEATVRCWGGSPGVRDRLGALARASAGLVLFQEYVPHSLDNWLATVPLADTGAVVTACALIESSLRTDVPAMNDAGLMHFDAHFGNVLTDGHRLFYTDFGLATSPDFDLSPAELVFLRRHRSHDSGYAAMRLVNWIVTNVCGIHAPADGGPAGRNSYIRACADGADPAGAPAELAAMIRRYAPVAAAMNDFYWDLFVGDRATPFPQVRVERALWGIRDF